MHSLTGRYSELMALQAEMQRVLPQGGPRIDPRFRDIRAQNQSRFDRSMRMRQRPTRVS